MRCEAESGTTMFKHFFNLNSHSSGIIGVNFREREREREGEA
jgi:hypothetical protein